LFRSFVWTGLPLVPYRCLRCYTHCCTFRFWLLSHVEFVCRTVYGLLRFSGSVVRLRCLVCLYGLTRFTFVLRVCVYVPSFALFLVSVSFLRCYRSGVDLLLVHHLVVVLPLWLPFTPFTTLFTLVPPFVAQLFVPVWCLPTLFVTHVWIYFTFVYILPTCVSFVPLPFYPDSCSVLLLAFIRWLFYVHCSTVVSFICYFVDSRLLIVVALHVVPLLYDLRLLLILPYLVAVSYVRCCCCPLLHIYVCWHYLYGALLFDTPPPAPTLEHRVTCLFHPPICTTPRSLPLVSCPLPGPLPVTFTFTLIAFTFVLGLFLDYVCCCDLLRLHTISPPPSPGSSIYIDFSFGSWFRMRSLTTLCTYLPAHTTSAPVTRLPAFYLHLLPLYIYGSWFVCLGPCHSLHLLLHYLLLHLFPTHSRFVTFGSPLFTLPGWFTVGLVVIRSTLIGCAFTFDFTLSTFTGWLFFAHYHCTAPALPAHCRSAPTTDCYCLFPRCSHFTFAHTFTALICLFRLHFTFTFAHLFSVCWLRWFVHSICLHPRYISPHTRLHVSPFLYTICRTFVPILHVVTHFVLTFGWLHTFVTVRLLHVYQFPIPHLLFLVVVCSPLLVISCSWFCWCSLLSATTCLPAACYVYTTFERLFYVVDFVYGHLFT